MNLKHGLNKKKEEKVQNYIENRRKDNPNYELPKKEKVSVPDIVCKSTEPEKYLGQYHAAVCLETDFIVTPEQEKEFSQKFKKAVMANAVNEKGEELVSKTKNEPYVDPFNLTRICSKATQLSESYQREAKMLAQKQQYKQEHKQEQTQGMKR